jgi:putative ABC transport system permease protein
MLAGELLLLIVPGILVGTLLGVEISSLFIPYFQAGSDPAALIPPYVVRIAWLEIYGIYALYSLLFLISFSLLTAAIRRIKIFQAIKLGETA